MRKKIDLTGKRFGRPLVIEEAGRSHKKAVLWRCLCDCGNKRVVIGDDLRSGHTMSCGCLRIDRITKHGMCNSSEYNTWASMIQRCTNKNSANYKHYGGRGINVCERWNSFKFFLKDMGKKPDSSFSIERRDNNKGYSPENCHWACQTIQMRNIRMSKKSPTGVKGVSFSKRIAKKYRAYLTLKGKSIHLGHFATIAEAAEARRLGEIKYWGRRI